jgi:hypothetical protein
MHGFGWTLWWLPESCVFHLNGTVEVLPDNSRRGLNAGPTNSYCATSTACKTTFQYTPCSQPVRGRTGLLAWRRPSHAGVSPLRLENKHKVLIAPAGLLRRHAIAASGESQAPAQHTVTKCNAFAKNRRSPRHVQFGHASNGADTMREIDLCEIGFGRQKSPRRTKPHKPHQTGRAILRLGKG